MATRNQLHPRHPAASELRPEEPIAVPAKDPLIPSALILYTERRTCASCNSKREYPLPDIVVQYTSGRRARYSSRIRQKIHHTLLERKVDVIETQTMFCPHCWKPGPAIPRASKGFLLQEWDAARAKPFLFEQSAKRTTTHKAAVKAFTDDEL